MSLKKNGIILAGFRVKRKMPRRPLPTTGEGQPWRGGCAPLLNVNYHIASISEQSAKQPKVTVMVITDNNQREQQEINNEQHQ